MTPNQAEQLINLLKCPVLREFPALGQAIQLRGHPIELQTAQFYDQDSITRSFETTRAYSAPLCPVTKERVIDDTLTVSSRAFTLGMVALSTQTDEILGEDAPVIREWVKRNMLVAPLQIKQAIQDIKKLGDLREGGKLYKIEDSPVGREVVTRETVAKFKELGVALVPTDSVLLAISAASVIASASAVVTSDLITITNSANHSDGQPLIHSVASDASKPVLQQQALQQQQTPNLNTSVL